MKSGTGEQGTKAWNAQAWLPAALLLLLCCCPSASFQCPSACVRSRGDTTGTFMENQHSLSWKSCVTTWRGEQSRNLTTCFMGNSIFSICLCFKKTAIMPPNWKTSIKCIRTNWNVSFGFQLLTVQPIYSLYFPMEKAIPNWQGRQLSLEIFLLFSSLKRVAVGMFLVCKGTLSYWRFSSDV